MTPEGEPCRLKGVQYATRKGGGQFLEATQRMKQPGKLGSSTQVRMWLVVKVKSDAVKKSIALQP